MIILCDVDGVCADFVGGLREKLAARGLKIPDPVKVWDFIDRLPNRTKQEAYSVMMEMDFWAKLPVIDGALLGIARLKLIRSADLVFVTSPHESCTGWESARRYWLRRVFGNDVQVIFAQRKELVRGDVLIDDNNSNVDRWAVHGGTALLFPQAYNRAGAQCTRESWARIVDEVGRIGLRVA